MATTDIGIGLKVDGEQEFKRAITDINREVKILGNEMKLVTETFRGNANSQEALRAKSVTLIKEMTAQTEKIEILKDALENAKKEFGENSQQAQNWQNSLLYAQTQLKKMENELKDVTYQLDHYDDEADEATTDTKDLGKSLEDAKDGASSFKEGISAMSVALGNFVYDILKTAVREIYEFGKQSIELASDLEEVQNVVDVTFGDASKAIYEFANTAPQAFGVTSLQAQQFAGRFGAAFKSMGIESEEALTEMSTTLVGLSGDLASFYNLSADETYTKVFSGVISGETEGLKALGVVMTETNLKAFAMEQGITKSYSAMTASEKAMLRYQYLLSATADAQGDFARTSDSYANQTKILQMNLQSLGAAIGSELLPTITSSVSSINGYIGELLQAFNEGGLSQMVNKAISIFAEIKQGIADMLPDIIPMGFQAIENFIMGLTENLPEMVSGGIDMVANLLSGLAEEAPKLIGMAFDFIVDFAGELWNQRDKIIEAGIQVGKALWEGIISMINSTKVGQFIQGLMNSAAGINDYDDYGNYTGAYTTNNFTFNNSSTATVDYAYAKLATPLAR